MQAHRSVRRGNDVSPSDVVAGLARMQAEHDRLVEAGRDADARAKAADIETVKRLAKHLGLSK